MPCHRFGAKPPSVCQFVFRPWPSQFQMLMRYLLAIACSLASLASAQPTSAQMQYPLSAVAAESGTIYVADRNLPGVWKIEADKLSRFFEGSKRYRTPLYAVRCVTSGQVRGLVGRRHCDPRGVSV